MKDQITKTFRYVKLYGLGRTVFKIIGRSRSLAFLGKLLVPRRGTPFIAVIGCGQFAFATIGYYLSRRLGRCIRTCFDIDPAATKTFSRFYGAQIAPSIDSILQDEQVTLIYIASNHASHSDYAVQALLAGKDVYVEKPVSVSNEQLSSLLDAIHRTARTIYVGYNRPFSKAVELVRKHAPANKGPLTLSCFVQGHVLTPDHWYRLPAEGTRICGNVGHWLDLAVNLLSLGQLEDEWLISVRWSDPESRDDNVSLTLTSRRGDLLNFVLTSRSEPPSGITETINLQWDDLSVTIADFHSIAITKGSYFRQTKFLFKDVGHRKAILQPFERSDRSWDEVVKSSLLMLRIARMVRDREQDATFSFTESLAELNSGRSYPMSSTGS